MEPLDRPPRPVPIPRVDDRSGSGQDRGAPASRRATILGRRDVALVPWVSMAVVSLAAAVSIALRGDASTDPLFWGAIGGAALSAVFTGLQDTRIGVRFRGSLWVYLLVSALLLAALSIAAIHDTGIKSVYFAPVPMLGAYIGLVFPRRWGAASLAVMLAATAAVQCINTETSLFDATFTGSLVLVGWLVGLLGRAAHGAAVRTAGALSNFDRLTGVLNRRGLLRQVDALLGPVVAEKDDAVALLIIDLDGFKATNDELGHAAGDELLAWVGRTIPGPLPADAEVGRIGGDEFAVLLPGASTIQATALARAIRETLSQRVGASVGVATSQTLAVSGTDLFRVADAALYVCKTERGRGVHTLVAGTAWTSQPLERPDSTGVKALSFARLRAAGTVPEAPEPGVLFGSSIGQGLLAITLGGVYIVVGEYVNPAGGFFTDVMHILGVPWILFLLSLAIVAFRHGHYEPGGRTYWAMFYANTNAVGLGVGTAMLAHGGLVAPVGAAFFLRVLFDASIMPARHSLVTLAVTLAWWTLVLILGPASALWVAPLQVAIFGAAFGLGTIAHRAFDDATRETLQQAHTDALTQVPNRLGFEREAEQALLVAQAQGSPLAVLALDLDDFKAVNDTHGHQAGDELLRQVAERLSGAFPDIRTIGRLGGDEFVLVVPVEAAEDAAVRARELAATLRSLVGASVGHAVFPLDGDDLSVLLLTADRRSYEQKRLKQAVARPATA